MLKIVIFLFWPIILLSRIDSIFFGFTFTDWQDFVAPGLLTVGGLVTLWRKFRSRDAKPRLAMMLAMGTSPLWPHITLAMMALEVQRKYGHWPQPMVDDPKNKLGNWAGFDNWFHATNYMEAISGAATLFYLGLLLVEWQHLTVPRRYSACLGFLVPMGIFCLDPGNLYEWWLDRASGIEPRRRNCPLDDRAVT